MANDALLKLIENLSLMTLGSVLLFLFVTHTGYRQADWTRQVVFGVILGLVSVLVVHFPLVSPYGATFDTRAAPVVLAGFYAGPLGGAVAAALGGAARFHLGGPAAIGGALSFLLYAAAGFAAAKVTPAGRMGPARLAGLAGFATIAVLPSFFIGQPFATGLAILERFWPVLLIGNVAGTVCLGLMIEQMFGVVLQRNRHRLRAETSLAANRAAGIGVWSCDFRTGEITWDEMHHVVMGTDRERFVPTFDTLRTVIHEQDVDTVFSAFEEARRGASRFDVDFRVRLPGGSIRHVRAHANFLGGRPGDPDLCVGVCIDRSREIALYEEVALKSLALDNAVCGIVIAEATAEQPIVFVNRAFSRLTGYSAEEVLGRNCRFMNRELEEQPGMQELRRALAGRQPVTVRLRNRRKDGSVFWNNLRVSPLRSSAGEVTHFIGVQEDVTELVEARVAAERSRDRLNAVLMTAPEAIISLDGEQRITSVNAAAERIFGWSAAELTGRSIDTLMPPSHRERHGELARGYIGDANAKTGGMRQGRLVDALRRDGTLFPARISLGRFVHDGQVTVSVCAQDMTELVEANKAEHELSRRLMKQLEVAREANLAKDMFLANMSHELRTPLNAIIGFADMIRMLGVSSLGAAKIHEYAEDIHDSGAHLLNLINDVLDLSRITSAPGSLDLKAIEAAKLVDAAVEMVTPIAAGKGIVFELQVAPSLRVMADRRSAHQCLLNVITNAIKFSPTGSTVSVEVAETPVGVEVRISDQGVGMPPAVLDRVGQPFMRSSNPTVASAEGTGLGLAITRRLMERQGGWLSIASEVDVGTTVTLCFTAQASRQDEDCAASRRLLMVS